MYFFYLYLFAPNISQLYKKQTTFMDSCFPNGKRNNSLYNLNIEHVNMLDSVSGSADATAP